MLIVNILRLFLISYIWEANPSEITIFTVKMLIKTFFDAYILAIIPTILRGRWRYLALGAEYILIYALAMIDIYCYDRIGTAISPTLLDMALNTNPDEAGGALSAFLTIDQIIHNNVMWVILLLASHIGWNIICKKKNLKITNIKPQFTTILCLLIIFTGISDIKAKSKYIDLWKIKEHGVYIIKYDSTAIKVLSPTIRIIFGYKYLMFNHGNSEETLEANSKKIRFTDKGANDFNIILVIGESYNKHHSSLYNYPKETTPGQDSLVREGSLIAFTNVLSSWNETLDSFKYMFSTYTTNDPDQWYKYPLFPIIFKQAGYETLFTTNQFVKSSSSLYDIAGNAFLNNDKLNPLMFSHRNKANKKYDIDLIESEYDSIVSLRNKTLPSLDIIHLIGQHFGYQDRYTSAFDRFKSSDYDREDLSQKQKQILACYDNATLYNDHVLMEIIKRHKSENAVIIYIPDHGEMVFDNCQTFGRDYSDLSPNTLHQTFNIPFWAWCSEKFIESHPDRYERLRAVKDKPFITDRLPHFLMGLAGIECEHYKPIYDILSEEYQESTPRIIQGKYDYDKLIND